MRTIAIWFFALSVALVRAQTNAPTSGSDAERDAYLREHDEYGAAVEEVHSLIQADKLQEAEEAVKRNEPKYAHKWSVGRFGYGPRMEIGEAYLARGDRENALRLFRDAKPGGGCGNCMASQHVHRNIRIAHLYETRLNFPAAFVAYLGVLPSTALGGGFFRIVLGLLYSGSVTLAPFVALVLFLRYRRRHQKQGMHGQQSPPYSSPVAGSDSGEA